jgi:hypothetical protein
MANIPEDDHPILERAIVREAAGVLHSSEALRAAIDNLLVSGFDRADIDLMASVESVRQKLGQFYIPAEDLADVPTVPRAAFVSREDTTAVIAEIAGVLTFIGATAATVSVVGSGGGVALAVAASVVAAGGAGTFSISRYVEKKQAHELEKQLTAGGIILWVRVRSLDQERIAQDILHACEAEAVRVHDITLPKTLKDIPFTSVRPDPWLGRERLGDL